MYEINFYKFVKIGLEFDSLLGEIAFDAARELAIAWDQSAALIYKGLAGRVEWNIKLVSDWCIGVKWVRVEYEAVIGGGLVDRGGPVVLGLDQSAALSIEAVAGRVELGAFGASDWLSGTGVIHREGTGA